MDPFDLKALATLGAVLLSIVSMLVAWSKRAGIKEAEFESIRRDFEDTTKTQAVRFDALYARFDLIERQTSERFERTGDKLNEALLTMAREHPTKRDLNELEHRIIEHIDMRLGKTRNTTN